MPEQRVSDELLARWESLEVRGDAPMREAEAALPVVIMELRDEREENARLREQVERWDSPEGRTNYDVAHAVALKDAERAVVEAAKAWRNSVHDEIADRLAAAVDALRKVEGESP